MPDVYVELPVDPSDEELARGIEDVRDKERLQAALQSLRQSNVAVLEGLDGECC